jgi:acetyl esterase/lipase
MSQFNCYLFKARWKIVELLLRALTNGNPPPIGKVMENIPYNNLHPKQKLDVYIPEGTGPFPVLVYIHGGGWTIIDKKTYSRICKEFASEKCIVVSINYRLGPKYGYPYILQDMADAVYFIHQHANEYGGDPGNIILAGDSGGAHMASWYAAALGKKELLTETKISNVIPRTSLKGLLLFYGVYDLSMEYVEKTEFADLPLLVESFLGKDPEEYKKRAGVVSTINHVTSDYPPVFISSGEKDALHQGAIALVQKLTENKIPYEALFFSKDKYPDAEHAFLNFYKKGCAQEAMRKAKEFMKRCYAGAEK